MGVAVEVIGGAEGEGLIDGVVRIGEVAWTDSYAGGFTEARVWSLINAAGGGEATFVPGILLLSLPALSPWSLLPLTPSAG